LISLLHTADWQIGRVFSQFEPDDAAALFEARFAVVERLASIATEQSVDAVLVAGDVFDAQTVTEKTIRRLFNAMGSFPGAWVLMPGNHDAALAESVWTHARRLGAIPANVIVCLEPKPVVVAGKFTLLPAPLAQRHTYADLTEWFSTDASGDGLPRIGLAHGSVQGILSEDIDSANPIAAGRAQGAGLAYLALGDWHGTKCVDDRTWYAGTPETDRFKANDSGQSALQITRVNMAGLPATYIRFQILFDMACLIAQRMGCTDSAEPECPTIYQANHTCQPIPFKPKAWVGEAAFSGVQIQTAVHKKKGPSEEGPRQRLPQA